MHRGRLVAGVLAAAAVLLASCGSEGGPEPEAAGGGSFPVTVTHGQGTVTVPAAPQRVVVLGLADTQIASALGAPIVGATRNSASADGSWLGVSPQVPAEVRTLDPLTVNIEALAALQPDLILMTSAQPAFSAAYEQISAVAPTISYRAALLEDSGADLTRLIGQALGKDAEAAALIQRSDDQLATFRADHPQLEGRTYTFGQFAQGSTYLVIAPDGPTAELFAALGMAQPGPIAALPVWQAGMAQVAPENLAVLDGADVAFLGVNGTDGERDFLAQPLVGDLDLVRSGGLRYLTVDQAALLLQPNPANTDAVLELIGPPLEEATA